MKWIVGISIIATVLGWLGTMTIPAATITPDQTLLRYFPPETSGIALIDVAALRNATLVKGVLDYYRPTTDRLPEFFIAADLVPQRDIDRITVGKITGRETLAIIDVRYDKFKAEQFLREKGIQPEAYLGRSVYSFDVQHGQTYDVRAVAFLDNLVIAGKLDAVKKALDQISLPGSQPLRSDLTDAIRTIEAGNQVWAVGDFSIEDVPAAGLHGPAPAVEMLKALRSGTYQMRVDSDVHARANGNFADAESAGNLADMVRGLIAVAKLQVAKQQPDLLHLLDGIQVSSNGPMLTVRIEEPGDLLMKLQNQQARKVIRQ